MKTIDIPTHAAVIAVGGKRAPLAELLDRVPAAATPWQVDQPETSADSVRIGLAEYGRVRVAMPRAHGKAIADVATIAKRHGAVSILLRLPGGPDDKQLAKGLAKVDRIIELDDASIEFVDVPMPVDLRHLVGGFDIIGDIHGMASTLETLLRRTGHMDEQGAVRPHPEGRRLVFLGDYVDRGPENRRAVEIVREAMRHGALGVLGNHDFKWMRWLQGRDVEIKGGLEVTVAELADTTPEWRADTAAWLEGLQTHLVLDGGRLVVAHAGLDEKLHGRMTPGATSMALYGKPIKGGTELDPDGYPLAEDWAAQYSGAATVVHGHVVHPEPRELNGVHAIDGGAVFGGSLIMMHYPEMTYTQVRADAEHYTPLGRNVGKVAGKASPT